MTRDEQRPTDRETVKIEVWSHSWAGKKYQTLLIGDRRVAGLKMINPKLEYSFSVPVEEITKAIRTSRTP